MADKCKLHSYTQSVLILSLLALCPVPRFGRTKEFTAELRGSGSANGNLLDSHR